MSVLLVIDEWDIFFHILVSQNESFYLRMWLNDALCQGCSADIQRPVVAGSRLRGRRENKKLICTFTALYPGSLILKCARYQSGTDVLSGSSDNL